MRAPQEQGRGVRLAELGRNETWLQDWLAEDPRRLGLGDLRTVGQELGYRGAGRLDLLMASGETHYAVEVQLGEVDYSHGFRVLDYWARNRRREPKRKHVAVLAAESARGRCRPALEALAEYIPLIVIELHAVVEANNAVSVRPEIVIASPSLDIAVPETGEELREKTPEDWEASMSPEAWKAHNEFIETARQKLGTLRVEYGLTSYIGVHRGRRLWSAIYPVRDGITVRLPDPDGARRAPSRAFELFRKGLATAGVPLAFEAGGGHTAHPLVLRMVPGDATAYGLTDLIKASADGLDPEKPPYTDDWPASRERTTGSVTEDWEDDFDPYYSGEFYEGPDHMSTYSTIVYFGSRDESTTLWASPDVTWDAEGKREFARRVLIHHLEKKPTKAQIEAFLKGPAAKWEDGQLWYLEAAELTAWLWDAGVA